MWPIRKHDAHQCGQSERLFAKHFRNRSNYLAGVWTPRLLGHRLPVLALLLVGVGGVGRSHHPAAGAGDLWDLGQLSQQLMRDPGTSLEHNGITGGWAGDLWQLSQPFIGLIAPPPSTTYNYPIKNYIK